MSKLSKKSVEDALGIPSIDELQKAMAKINDPEEESDESEESWNFDTPVATQEEIKTALAMASNMRTNLMQIPDILEKEEEIDDIAETAAKYFEDIMDKGFNAEDRYASELFNSANAVLKTALDGKNAIINAKLKLLDLELKKMKIEADMNRNQGKGAPIKDVNGTTYANRNDLLNDDE